VPLGLQDAEATVRDTTHCGAGGHGQTERRAAELLEPLYAQLLLTGTGYIEAVGAARCLGCMLCGRIGMSVCPGADGSVAYELCRSARAQPPLTSQGYGRGS